MKVKRKEMSKKQLQLPEKYSKADTDHWMEQREDRQKRHTNRNDEVNAL